jgi:hypothetical protein
MTLHHCLHCGEGQGLDAPLPQPGLPDNYVYCSECGLQGPLDVLEALAARLAPPRTASLNWQCSGCGWAFACGWQKTCPCCLRDDYWTGSVFPDARLWDGSRGTRVPHTGGVTP